MLTLNEDWFEDLPAVETPPLEVEEDPQPPKEGEDMGIADMLLSAIENKIETIREYNMVLANLGDKEDLKEVLSDILTSENETLGKLQSMLQTVSPNAVGIMNGAVEAEQTLDNVEPDAVSPVDEAVEPTICIKSGSYNVKVTPEQAKKIGEVTSNWGGKSWAEEWTDADEKAQEIYDAKYKDKIDNHNLEVFGFTW